MIHSHHRAGLWHPYEKPMYGVLLNPYHPLAYGLVGCWLFNEGGGNIVYDLSGHGNHGTLGGGTAGYRPSWTVEKIGSALKFDGSDDFVATGGRITDTVDNFSVVAWVNPSVLSGIRLFVYNGDDSGGWGFGSDDQSFIALYGNVAWIDSQYDFPSTGQWYHLAMTRVSGTLYFYVNGVQQSGTSTATPETPNDYFEIGHQPQHTGRYFDGIISIVMVYDRPLAADEIWQLYTDPFCMFYHPLEKELLKITGITPLNIEIPLNCKSSSKLISKNSISKDCKLKDTYQKKYYCKIPFNLIFDSKLSDVFQLSLLQSLLVPLYLYPVYYSPRKKGLIGILKPSIYADNYYYAYPSWLSAITPLNVELSLDVHENFAFSHENTLINSLLFSTSKYYVVGSVVIPLALGSQYISLTSILSADSSLSLKSNYKNFISSRFDTPLIINPLITEILEQQNILSFTIDNAFVPIIKTVIDSHVIQNLDANVCSSLIRDLNIPINLYFNYLSTILFIINFSNTLNVSSKMALENMIEAIIPAILKDTYSSEYEGVATLTVSTDAEFVPLLQMIYEYSLTAPLLFSPILTTVKKAQALIKYLTIDIKKFNISIDIETIEQDG